jgi:hypothetical protein
VQHPLAEMLAQRIYGLALGYEDLNDHEELRRANSMSNCTARMATWKTASRNS